MTLPALSSASTEQPPVRQYGTTISETATVKQSYVEPAGCTQLIKKLSFEQKHIIHFPHLFVCLFVCASTLMQ